MKVLDIVNQKFHTPKHRMLSVKQITSLVYMICLVNVFQLIVAFANGTNRKVAAISPTLVLLSAVLLSNSASNFSISSEDFCILCQIVPCFCSFGVGFGMCTYAEYVQQIRLKIQPKLYSQYHIHSVQNLYLV